MKHVLVLTAALVAPLLAGDPWKDKKPAEWNEKEVHAVLTKSPWAKEVSVSMGMAPGSMPSGGGGRRGGALPTASDWGAAVPSGGGTSGPGDMGARSSGPPPLNFQVRWVAAPVREAMAIAKEPAIRPELFNQYYVLTVSQAGGRQRQGAPETLSQEQMTQLKTTTSLHCKGKEPLRPELVGLAKSAEGSITVFLFPRKSAIGPDDKDVEFQTHFGPLAIKSKFDLKKMVWNGAPAL